MRGKIIDVTSDGSSVYIVTQHPRGFKLKQRADKKDLKRFYRGRLDDAYDVMKAIPILHKKLVGGMIDVPSFGGK